MAAVAIASVAAAPTGGVAGPNLPRTGFERSEGASWTTPAQERRFLRVLDRSRRAEVVRVGWSIEHRRIDLIRVGHPRPHPVRTARRRPTVLFVCSQHGNEPAGRETCLQLARDLAFATNPTFVRQLRRSTILFIPSANPDGLFAGTYVNGAGIDLNRDHLNLASPEARTISEVVKYWEPDIVLDLHEYGPSVPVMYDDEILYLWPRNLNVDRGVHSLSKQLAIDYIAEGARDAGYTADEFGMMEVAGHDLAQTEGDHDEGILRNALGLRHAIAVLIESAVDPDVRNGPDEVYDRAAVNRRRVASQMQAALDTLRFMRDHGVEAMRTSRRAARRKALEGLRRDAPIYFGGADNDPPDDTQVLDRPPCGYLLHHADEKIIERVLRLHGIKRRRTARGAFIPMWQAAEPVIPLLLDARAAHDSAEARPLRTCKKVTRAAWRPVRRPR